MLGAGASITSKSRERIAGRFNKPNLNVQSVSCIYSIDQTSTQLVERVPELLLAIKETVDRDGSAGRFLLAGSAVGITHTLTTKYASILEQLYLIYRLPPWQSNQLKRLSKTPKLHFMDTGLLAGLQGLTAEALRAERRRLGSLLETFVLTELLKLFGWSERRIRFSHFQDKEKSEVDIVMQDLSGKIVGVEVKASATVTSADLATTRWFLLRKISTRCPCPPCGEARRVNNCYSETAFRYRACLMAQRCGLRDNC